jgi:hypothetical protein
MRWQPIFEPSEPTLFGAALSCAFGGDCGKFNTAKPRTEDWHMR